MFLAWRLTNADLSSAPSWRQPTGMYNTVCISLADAEKSSAILLLDYPTSFQYEGVRIHPFASEPTFSPESSFGLQATIKMANTISEVYDAIGDKISPFVLFVNYKAASIYLEEAIARPDSDAVENFDVLKKCLKMFRRRWLVAGMFFRPFYCPACFIFSILCCFVFAPVCFSCILI